MATVDNLWVMDAELSAQIIQVKARLDVPNCLLKLFTDDETPHPEWTNASYTEATYTGYAAVDLEGKWETPSRDEAGVWSMDSEIITFTCTSGDAETVEGFALDVGGTLRVAARFPAPHEVSVGNPIRVRITYVQYAALVFAQLLST